MEQLNKKVELELEKSSLNHFTKGYIPEGQEQIQFMKIS